MAEHEHICKIDQPWLLKVALILMKGPITRKWSMPIVKVLTKLSCAAGLNSGTGQPAVHVIGRSYPHHTWSGNNAKNIFRVFLFNAFIPKGQTCCPF